MIIKEKMVSIVLPVHNGEKYLRTAIESILNQTYRNIELIVVNDFSTDLSEVIIKEYMDKDPRIILVNNEVNLKLPASLNAGFRRASGQYLTWTSDDNILYPNMVERMAEELNKGSVFVYADVDYIGEDGSLLEEQPIHGDDIWRENIVGACFMYTREIYEKVGEYDTSAFLVEDYDYWIRVSIKYELKHLHEKLYAYRHHGNSLTNSRKNDVLRATLNHLDRYLLSEDVTEDNKNKIRMQFAAYYYELGEQRELKRLLKYMKSNAKDVYKQMDLIIKLYQVLPKSFIEALRMLC